MSIKKNIKKIISSFFLKGVLKEKLKLFYYNTLSEKHISFKIIKDKNSKKVFKTTYNNIDLITNQPLYSIAPDFDYYQHFYKVKPNDIIIDGGANFGHLGLLFLKIIGNNGLVYCFEPDKYNIKTLYNNFNLNKDIGSNYKIVDQLMWNEKKLVDFQESGTVASSAHWFSSKENIVKKQAITLDEWCKLENVEKIDFIKMDIEGAELEALEGCKNLIKKYQPNFAIASYHLVDNELTYIKVESFFKEINYPYVTKKFRGNEIITFAGSSINTKND